LTTQAPATTVQVKPIKRVTVLGAGTMGHGIAQLASVAGCDVVIRDVEQKFLDAGLEKIKWSVGKFVEKKKLTKDEADEVLFRIKTTTDLKLAVSQADLVIEAVPEVLLLKKETFMLVDRHAPIEAILATNTSALPIDEMASVTARAQKVIGMHFFNPPQLMPLVEITRGSQTADWVVKTIEEFARRLGKETVICKKYVPGFIVNNILGSFNQIAMTMFQKKEGTPEEIDSALKFKVGFPMGIFELTDYSGIDVAYNIHKFFEGLGFGNAPPVLKQLVDEGRLGQKTGRGFYEWKDGRRPKISPEAGQNFDITPIVAAGVNAAAELIRQEVATKEDIDKALKLGLGFPKGVLEMGDDIGLDRILESLKEFYAKHNSQNYKPSPLLLELVSNEQIGKRTGRGFYQYERAQIPIGAEKPISEVQKFDTILVKVEPETGLAWITLNRPHRLNTITPEMLDELSKALDQLEHHEKVRVLIVKGEGEKAFSAGADVSTFQGGTPVSIAELSRKGQTIFQKLESFPHPTVAAVRGYCLGGGCELMMACDFRVAGTSAQIGQPEINLGIIPGWGGTQRMTRILGEAKAKEMIMFGDRIGAEEAFNIGLVNKVVLEAQFEQEVKKFALKLASGPPIALKLAKKSINIASNSKGVEAGFEVEAQSFAMTTQTEDAIEGISSFLSKKKPEFKGK
jgi:enoyl-CoA hydratase/3-hydroxyacyl-CoA dehydrogenase